MGRCRTSEGEEEKASSWKRSMGEGSIAGRVDSLSPRASMSNGGRSGRGLDRVDEGGRLAGERPPRDGGDRGVVMLSPERGMLLGCAAKLSSSSSSSHSLSSSISAGVAKLVREWKLVAWDMACRNGSSRDSGLSRDRVEAVLVVGTDMFVLSSSHFAGEGGLPLASSPKNLPSGDHRPRFSLFWDSAEDDDR